MTEEERDKFVELCRGGYDHAHQPHLEAIYGLLIREGRGAVESAKRHRANNCPSLANRMDMYAHAHLGAALVLGWPGPVVEGEEDDDAQGGC